MRTTELEITSEIDRLRKESLSEAEKIIELVQTEQRQAVIDWIKADPDVKVIIAFSGGKDSVYMVLYHLFVLQTPKERIELWHHDVDGHGEELFDWKVTPDYCRAFAKAFGLKLLFSYRKNGIVGRLLRNGPLENVYYQTEPDGKFHVAESDPKAINTGGRWMQQGDDKNVRWCTSVAKIDVAGRVLTNDPRFKGTKQNPVKILFCTGERHDESGPRSKLKEVEVYRGKTLVSYRQVVLWRLNVEVKERDVWALMEKHNVQPHPCYMIGWNRCSCQLCIYNADVYWRAMLDISPEKMIRVRELEEHTAKFAVNQGKEHTLFNKYTIFEKAMKGNEGLINMNDPVTVYWVKQATEKYDHPIIIDNWKLPKGALMKEKCGAT